MLFLYFIEKLYCNMAYIMLFRSLYCGFNLHKLRNNHQKTLFNESL